MAVASNLRNIQKFPDGAYLCIVDIDFENDEPISVGCEYGARDGDNAPVNLWILSEIAKGTYTITDYVFVRDISYEWQMVRGKRDGLIKASDWTQFPDTQARFTDAQKTAWATYRQALRDIPQTFADPADVVWPTPPA